MAKLAAATPIAKIAKFAIGFKFSCRLKLAAYNYYAGVKLTNLKNFAKFANSYTFNEKTRRVLTAAIAAAILVAATAAVGKMVSGV